MYVYIYIYTPNSLKLKIHRTIVIFCSLYFSNLWSYGWQLKLYTFKEYNLMIWYCVIACMLSCVQLFATPWTIAHQASLYIEFSRQEYWSGLPFPPSGHLPSPRIKPVSPGSSPLACGFFSTSATWEAYDFFY